MKIDSITPDERGSVLITCLLTITILTMICAASLYVTSQNANSGMQTASWQLSLAGDESAVDQGFNALNTDTPAFWGNWHKVTGSLPASRPTGGSLATAKPILGDYNYYYPPSLALAGSEGANAVTSWVTIDRVSTVDQYGNIAPDVNGPSYRIRATGVAADDVIGGHEVEALLQVQLIFGREPRLR